MSLNLAELLIRRLATDVAFRQHLAALDGPAKRAFLDANGYRGVTAEWLQSIALPAFTTLVGEKIGQDDAMAAVTAATTAAAVVPAASAGVLYTCAPAASAGVLYTCAPAASAGVLYTCAPAASAGVLYTGAPGTGPAPVAAPPTMPKPDDGKA